MGIMAYSSLWVMQDLYHQPYVRSYGPGFAGCFWRSKFLGCRISAFALGFRALTLGLGFRVSDFGVCCFGVKAGTADE